MKSEDYVDIYNRLASKEGLNRLEEMDIIINELNNEVEEMGKPVFLKTLKDNFLNLSHVEELRVESLEQYGVKGWAICAVVNEVVSEPLAVLPSEGEARKALLDLINKLGTIAPITITEPQYRPNYKR